MCCKDVVSENGSHRGELGMFYNELVGARPISAASNQAWTLNRTVTRSINGFNSRCLHIMTGEHYRETATAPAYDLVLAVRRRRLRYLGHALRMPADKMVRCALMALVSDSVMYPTGSLFSDCQGVAPPQLVAMAANRAMWRAKVASLS